MSDAFLTKAKQKAEAMLEYQKRANQDFNEGPYPDMKKLIKLVELYEEALNKQREFIKSANYDGRWLSIIDDALVAGERVKSDE